MRRIIGGTGVQWTGGEQHLRIILFLVIIILNFQFSILNSYARSIPTINRDKAREVAREQVVWKDRLCPLSTAARDFLRAVYGKTSYQGLTPEQVVYGWRLRPDVWKDEPMILISDADLRRQLHIEGDYAKFSELFDDTLGYRLSALGSDLPERMRQLARETPAATGLDEKVGQIILLTQGRLFQPRPVGMQPMPSWRVEAEILWNHTPLWVIILLPIAVAIVCSSIKRS